MNTICLTLCAVLVISFNVAPIVAANTCRNPYDGRNYRTQPVSEDCDQDDPNSCQNGSRCLELVTAGGEPAGAFGCCMPIPTTKAQHPRTRDSAHKHTGVTVAR